MHAHTHTCMHVHTHTHTHACMHAHTHTHTHTCMHTHTHTHTHTDIHTHTHTHTHIHSHIVCGIYSFLLQHRYLLALHHPTTHTNTEKKNNVLLVKHNTNFDVYI